MRPHVTVPIVCAPQCHRHINTTTTINRTFTSISVTATSLSLPLSHSIKTQIFCRSFDIGLGAFITWSKWWAREWYLRALRAFQSVDVLPVDPPCRCSPVMMSMIHAFCIDCKQKLMLVGDSIDFRIMRCCTGLPHWHALAWSHHSVSIQ